MAQNKFQIVGKLHEKGDVRFVGHSSTHRIQNFVIRFENEQLKPQYRIMEACKSAVDELALVKIGEEIECIGFFKGKQRTVFEEGVNVDELSISRRFNNLDECHEIRNL